MLKSLNKWKALLVCTSIVVFSCAGTQGSVNSRADYTNSSTVLYEVSVAEKYLAKEPLKALSKALVLKSNTEGYNEVETLYSSALQECNKVFFDAVTAMQWDKAMLYFSSLSNAGFAPSGWTLERLKQQQRLSWQREGNEALLQTLNITRPKAGSISLSSSVIEKALDGTVTVWVDRGTTIQKGMGYADIVIGSGFFIDKRGYILTNYHVIQSEVDPTYEGYSRVYIKDPNNTTIRIPAKVIGWDAVLDVALLKTEITPEYVFSFGSSKDLSVGSRIYAIGSPAGLEKTITSGIVSAKNRRLLSLGSVLQIDAAINHGNSGGPLIDEQGNVQAIVFAGLEQNEGLNFAIPIEFVTAILPRLFAGGAISHGWFGNFGHSLLADEVATTSKGVYIDYILPFSPAETSTMNEGDIITKINGITVKSIDDIKDLLFSYVTDTIIKVEGFAREKQVLSSTNQSDNYTPKTWYVQLGTRPEFPGKDAYKNDVVSHVMLPFTGMKLEHISGKSFRIADVIKGSSADELGFAKNDYVELKGEKLDSKQNIIYISLYAKRRKLGYIEGFLGLAAYLDDPSYF